jgi:hypothetical protein
MAKTKHFEPGPGNSILYGGDKVTLEEVIQIIDKFLEKLKS